MAVAGRILEAVTTTEAQCGLHLVKIEKTITIFLLWSAWVPCFMEVWKPKGRDRNYSIRAELNAPNVESRTQYLEIKTYM